MSENQVAIWVESYPVCAHVTLAIESMYSADDEMKEEKRKEERMFLPKPWNISNGK